MISDPPHSDCSTHAFHPALSGALHSCAKPLNNALCVPTPCAEGSHGIEGGGCSERQQDQRGHSQDVQRRPSSASRTGRAALRVAATGQLHERGRHERPQGAKQTIRRCSRLPFASVEMLPVLMSFCGDAFVDGTFVVQSVCSATCGQALTLTQGRHSRHGLAWKASRKSVKVRGSQTNALAICIA